MAKALFLSPMIPSTDMDRSAAFFVDCLDFRLVFASATYRICEKDGLTVHFLPAAPAVGQMELYLEVDDVDGLWVLLEHKVRDLRHKAPFNRDYGMREIHIEIPATNALLFIGESIPRP